MAQSTDRLSETIEDYLQTIYSLNTEGEKVISARLARWMRVTPPTAWATIQRMQRDGMVDIDSRKTIQLTKKGQRLAESVARRHRLSERFLSEVLGFGWAEAHEEAHQFEHGMTPSIEAKMMVLMGNPTTCPHGSPIPGTGATLDPAWRPIDSFDVGDRIRIHFISEELEEDNELLRFLEKHELKPGREVKVLEKVVANGLMTVRSGEEDVSIGLQVAARMRAELL
jgi:DtxR family Mn-dependent transcriptional regulator